MDFIVICLKENINTLDVDKNMNVIMLGAGAMNWEKHGGGIKVFIPKEIRDHPPCDYAWSFNISGTK